MFVFLLLLIWPIAEIFVAIEIAEAIGVGLMLLLLIASWPVGLWALRRQGSVAWRRLGDATAAGRSPGRAVLDGVLVLIGGILMIVPGFITDALGALLLLPPSRAMLRGALVRNLRSRLVIAATHVGRNRSRYDVDSTATDVEPPRLRR